MIASNPSSPAQRSSVHVTVTNILYPVIGPAIYAEWTLLPQLFGPVYFQSHSGVWLVFIVSLLFFFLKIYKFSTKSVDPDQTPRSAASDLGLHCWPLSLLKKARHKFVGQGVSFQTSNPK